MAHCFYFKIPNDQMQMIILFQWSNKLQYSFVSGLTQFNDPNHLTLSQKPQDRGGWGENPTDSDEGDSNTF